MMSSRPLSFRTIIARCAGSQSVGVLPCKSVVAPTPRTCIADIEVVPVLFRWELGSWFVLDEISENGLSSLELARSVARFYPVGDVHLIALSVLPQQKC